MVLALDLEGSGFDTNARLMSPNEGETGLVLVEAVGRKIIIYTCCIEIALSTLFEFPSEPDVSL